ncbi:uncharacterized protein LOC143675714 [Tamandua tetradactyla]|uniref:uncharacterized protein LOC143675714 n=1 Tax=Tamandua tetradactyla TaxID=48850 RepID=UPI004053E588
MYPKEEGRGPPQQPAWSALCQAAARAPPRRPGADSGRPRAGQVRGPREARARFAGWGGGGDEGSGAGAASARPEAAQESQEADAGRLCAAAMSRDRAGMTVKLGAGSSGEEGLKKLGKRAADEESLEREGAGGGEAAEETSSTKKEEITSPGSDSTPAPSGLPQGPCPLQVSSPDQHHFLRSSLRPQSKRLRKDSSCAVGSSGTSSSGPGEKELTVVDRHQEMGLASPPPHPQEARAHHPGT